MGLAPNAHSMRLAVIPQRVHRWGQIYDYIRNETFLFTLPCAARDVWQKLVATPTHYHREGRITEVGPVPALAVEKVSESQPKGECVLIK